MAPGQYQAIEERKPKLGCCGKFEKFIVWIVNFVLFVVGLAQIAAGAWAWKSDASDWTGTGVPKACIAMGLFLVLISFLGCCGAWKENRPMLWFYAFLIFALVLGQVGALSVAAVSRDYTMRFMQEVWDHMTPDAQKELEKTYKCCSFMGSAKHNGTYSADDHEEYLKCSKEHENDGWENPKTGLIPACYDQAKGEVEKNLKTILIAVAVVGGVQIVILFMTMCLISGISAKTAAKKQQKEDQQNFSNSGYPNI